MKQFLYVSVILVMLLLNSCEKGSRQAIIETEFGNIKIELMDSTPFHRDNFVKLVNQGFYNDLLFHRVVKDFMIQGGDPDSKNAPQNKRLGMGGPGYRINAEIGALHYRGALAAARKGGASNPEMKSSGSQFYLVNGKKKLTLKDISYAEKYNKMKYTQDQIDKYLKEGGYPILDTKYTVFGKIIEGMDVLDKISSVEVGKFNRPKKDIKMKVRMIN